MASTTHRSRLVLFAACGVLAPLVYAAAAIAADLQFPGYDDLNNAINELGATGALV